MRELSGRTPFALQRHSLASAKMSGHAHFFCNF